MPGSGSRRVASFAWLVLAAACDQPTDPVPVPEARLLVHAVLDVGAPVQTILVERIMTGFGPRAGHVPGSDVTITTPSGAVFRAIETSTTGNGFSQGEYTVAELGSALDFVPGGTYTLHVHTPQGEDVTGTTTMPLAPAFKLPVQIPSFQRSRDTLRMAWPRVPGAASYQVNVKTLFNGGPGFRDYTIFTDTSITIAGTARTFENDAVFLAGTAAMVSVVAVDDNYYTYYHTTVDPFAGAPPSRLEGAVGVFGSIAPLRLVILESVVP